MEKKIIEEYIPEYDLKIRQYNKGFKYGVDSIQLFKFVLENEKKVKNIADFCSGSGIIGLLVSKSIEFNKMDFYEKQKDFSNINKENININFNTAEQSKFKVYNIDIKDIVIEENINLYDTILINPPYKKNGTGISSILLEKDIAKNEQENFLSDLFWVVKHVLNKKGRMYMVTRPERIVDIFYEARKNKIEPKKIKFIVNNKKIPKMVLIQFIKNAGEFLKFESNIEV